jgi:hypothetical protein
MSGLKRAFLAALLTAVSLNAFAVTVDAFDRGWYQQNLVNTTIFTHQPDNLNYFIGVGQTNVGTLEAPVFQGVSSRSFFGFDLTAYAGQTFTSATLRLYNPKVGDPIHNPLGDGVATENGFFQFNNDPANTRQCQRAPAGLSGSACEGYELFDVTTDKTALRNGTGGANAYNDLANGALYGSFIVTAADNGQFVNITLNSAALSAINAAAGSSFYVGARQFTFDSGLGGQGSFGFTDSDLSDTQLVLTTAAPVPEPGYLALFGIGLAVVGYARRKAGVPAI